MNVNSDNNRIQTIIDAVEKCLTGQPAAIDVCGDHSDPLNRLAFAVNALLQKTAARESEKGIPSEFVGVTHDVTEHKKVQEALRESEKRYRMIVENMRESITTLDLSLNYTYQSPSEVHVTGYTAEELVKIPIRDMVTPESYALIEQIMTQEFAREFGGEPVDPQRSRTFEIEVRHKNGGTIWEEITVSFNRDENGKPLEIMMVGRDVTGRKKMEQTIRENEKLYRLIVENMQDTIVLLDMNLRYIYQSPSEIRITGYTPEEIMNIPAQRQATPESYTRAVEILSEELEREASGVGIDSQRSRTFEMEVYHKEGGTVWLEMTASFQRDETGKPIGILMAGKNISERKKAEAEKARLEAQLLQAQKLETVGRLAGGVAHDFNNMLNVILGYIDLIKLKLPSYHPVAPDIGEIEKAACRSRDLTAQLLAFSRKQIIRPQVVNLNDLIEDIKKTLIRLIGEDIVLQISAAGDLGTIQFDPTQMEQILINLAVNARDAMPQGGKLILATANIEADGTFRFVDPDFPPGDYVSLSVSDTGCGIEQDHLPHIFEPFFTTKDIGKGTGLGLATVWGIVKQNKGFIHAVSETGRGSTFTIYLPAAGEMESCAENIPEATPQQGSGTILIVEDDEMVLNMVADMVQALGYRVIAHLNPLDALSFCENKESQIDLVITDVVMPALSGKELRERLRAARPELNVLFMSGYTTDTIAHHGILEEGVQFLQKPFSLNDLAGRVSQLIHPKKARS